MPTVFLSYSRNDLKWRDLVREALLQVGATWTVEVFVDESLAAGAEWQKKLRAAVQSASVFVALVSESWCASRWGARELGWALKKRDPDVTWIAIDESKPPHALAARNAALPPDEPLRRLEREPRLLQQKLKMAATRILEHLDPLRPELRNVLPPKYTLLERLYDGRVTAVFAALDRTLGRRVIVRAAKDPKNNAIFDSTMRSLAQLERHAAFPVLYGAWFDRAPHCSVMEYIDGSTLAEHLSTNERGWHVEEAVEFICRLGDGLAFVHRAGLEHGDLRPSKIRVTTRKDAYITGRRMLESELGAENMREVLHGDDQHAKTERLAYLAPEHFYPMGHRPLGTTDQYMLGLILYHVIRHKAPQTIDEESIEKVKAGEYPRFLRLPLLSDVTPECPRVLAEVVARMTQHDPKDRYRHIEDALFEVRGCLPIHLALVEESLARLTRDPEDERRFFEAFYEQLIESDAGIRRLFEARLGSQKDPRRQPGWRLQQRKLKDSVLALIAYARRVPTNDDTNPLFRVAQAHATTYRVEAGWYDAFMEAFVKTMRAKEEETLARRQTAYTVSPLPVLEQAWRQMLHAGILYMSKHGVADASCPRGEAPPPDHGGSPARAPRRAPRARRRA